MPHMLASDALPYTTGQSTNLPSLALHSTPLAMPVYKSAPSSPWLQQHSALLLTYLPAATIADHDPSQPTCLAASACPPRSQISPAYLPPLHTPSLHAPAATRSDLLVSTAHAIAARCSAIYTPSADPRPADHLDARYLPSQGKSALYGAAQSTYLHMPSHTRQPCLP